jgi:vacuolar protein sorting-associated protein 13A/C
VINGSVKDLQLYTCNYNQFKRTDAKSNVLYPVTISLAGSTPEGKGLHVELLVTDIRLGVSPATIELLSRVAATATGSGVNTEADEDEFKDHSDVWDQKPFNEHDHWFFKTDEGVEVTENLAITQAATEAASPAKPPSQEMCIISMPSVIVTVEAGVGNKTLPMLIIETSLKGSVCNWSSQLSVDAVLTLQMNYYNSRLALWEPLIEPVEMVKNDKTVLAPWELKVEVSMNDREEVNTPTEGFENLEISGKQPLMDIDVLSDHSMELVVTKTCLEVLNNLGKAFATAMKPGEVKLLETTAPYKIVNELGYSVTVLFKRGSFTLFDNEDTQEVILESGAEAALQRKSIILSSSPMVGMQLAADALMVKNYFVNVKVGKKWLTS